MQAAVLVPIVFTLTCVTCFPTIAPAVEVDLNGHAFTLPDGFTVELVAGPPLVERPIVADFDEQGRLYVAESSGTNDPVQKQLAEKPHRILRLEDSDGDGTFDRRTDFAEAMMFPEGAMWLDGSLYVSAPPAIWKLTDTDGDGVADERSVWFDGQTLTGCANDLHGPYAGRDGWIYWCKGAFAEQTYDRPGREPLVTRAAHIFRARPDGTGIEPVMTGGMDNPVDVVFTPGGERIFTTTFFQHPGGGNRDGLIHAIYGGVYGKVHDVIEGHSRTSPDVMPVLAHLGPAAPSGLAHYDSSVFGDEYHGNLFAAQFNMQKISRHVLTREGATFTTRDEDFLASDNKDFHPTDVLTDADGSLVVTDTGGWYKLCCPTSQLWKPDVLGGIYRVRRVDAPHVHDPRGRKLDWPSFGASELIDRLGDARPAVRDRAIETLAARGRGVVAELEDAIHSGESAALRTAAVWAATRIDSADARAAVRAALRDDNETVRQAAIHSVSVWRDHKAGRQLIELLESPSHHNRRAAAEALGRIGDASAVPPLLAALREPGDGALEHSLTFALIEIGDADSTGRGLADESPSVRRAALVALDQMRADSLTAAAVAAALVSPNEKLRETAGWIAGRHPEWGEHFAGIFRQQLSSAEVAGPAHHDLAQQMGRLSSNNAIADLVAELLSDTESSPAARRAALEAMATANLRRIPDAWVDALANALAGDDANLMHETAQTVRSFGLGKDHANAAPIVTALRDLAGRDRVAAETRLVALAGTGERVGPLAEDVFAFLHGQLAADDPRLRSLAVQTLARAPLSRQQLLMLADSLKKAGPLELGPLLGAFEQSTDEEVGLEVVAALDEAASLTSLRAEMLRPRLEKFGRSVESAAQSLYEQLEVGVDQQRASLEELLEALPEGDIRRGQAVFNGTKAACASCHAIGYLGGTLGPDLTKIGQVRDKRDLLESIVFPSASFVRSYEPLAVQTMDGKLHNGLVERDAPEEITLALSADQVVRIPREDVEDAYPGTISIMPAGLDQQLTLEELADLVAFLEACK
jgi:putative membrane-bound dehydrogenase-like protein